MAASLLPLAVVVAVALFAASPASALCYDPPTIPEVNVTQYLGLWYQVVVDPISNSWFERNISCPDATYGLRADGKISIANTGNIGSPEGPISNVTGYAYIPDASKPGQLKVHLDQAKVPFDAPYWILQVGPVDENDQYSYAVISDNFCVSLFVISRQQSLPPALANELQQFLTGLGFDVEKQWINVDRAGCAAQPFF